MKLKNYQQLAAFDLAGRVTKFKVAAIYAPPRIGKSLITLEAAKLSGAEKMLVLTKKAAIKGWMQYREFYNFDVTNYEQIEKITDDYDLIIIDESHNFNAFPRMSQRHKNIKRFARGTPIILASGTPSSEGALGLFSQFALSDFTPTGDMNAYEFFRKFGIPTRINIGGVPRELYKRCRTDDIRALFDPHIVYLDYDQTDISYDHSDFCVKIDEGEDFMNAINEIKGGVFKDTPLPTAPARLMTLHQIESGYFNGETLFESAKIKWLKNYIAEHKGESVVVMAYFIAEQEMLTELFKGNNSVSVLSSTRYCEGVDLSDYDHFILYSFGYSGAKFIQLRERVVNLNKNKKTYAIIPIIKRGISERVYQAVSKKKDFNNKMLLGFINE